MKVIVNSKLIELFEGAKVEHAIRKFAPTTLKAVKQGLLYASDQFGNKLALDGSLADNDIIHIQEVPSKAKNTN